MPVVQSLGGTMVSIVAKSCWVSNWSYVWFHPEGVSCEASHFPFWDPPHGPFIRLFAHRLTGHNPPVVAKIQLPQPAPLSQKTPCSVGPSIKVVFTPGKILILGNLSAMYCTPTPQAMERTASQSLMISLMSSINSHSHCLSVESSMTSTCLSANVGESRSCAASSVTCFSPPVWHMVTHEPQPSTQTLLNPESICLIS